MSTWLNNYDPQNISPVYPWKYGGYNGYRGYSGQPGFKRDLGYVNQYQGVGTYYTGPRCGKCGTYYDDTHRCKCNDPFNPFDDDYRGGLAWNL